MENLTELNLPDTVRKIGNYLCEGCTNLTYFHYPVGLSDWNGVDILMGQSGNVFKDCVSLKSVTVPEGVETLPTEMFYNAIYLEEVKLPDTLRSIGDAAFMNCEVLPWLYVNANVNEIGDNAFKDSAALTVESEYGAYTIDYCRDNGVNYYYLTPVGIAFPQTVYQTLGADLLGAACASVDLTRVTVRFTNEDTGTVLRSDEVNPGATTYALSGLLEGVDFAHLDLGRYRLYFTAETALTREVMLDWTFEVKEPPLSVTLGDDCAMPDTFLQVGGRPEISGTLLANVPMTRVEAVIANPTGDTVVASSAISPNAESCDLSALMGGMPALTACADYTFSLRVSGAGMTLTVHTQPLFVVDNYNAAGIAADALFSAPLTKNVNKLASLSAYYMSDCNSKGSHKGYNVSVNLGFGDRAVYEDEANINFVLMWKDIDNSNGSRTRLWAVGIEGTTSTQWAADFDVGDDFFHRGFYQAAREVFNELVNYQGRINAASPKDPAKTYTDDKIWVVGHSRGAAAANILGGSILRENGYSGDQIYCFCFACPNVYKGSASAVSYVRVYNIAGDIVPRVPLSTWGYSRYGVVETYDGDSVCGKVVLRKSETDNIEEIAGLLPGSAADICRDLIREIDKGNTSDVLFGVVKNIFYLGGVKGVTHTAASAARLAVLLTGANEIYGAVRGTSFANALKNSHNNHTYFDWINSVYPVNYLF